MQQERDGHLSPRPQERPQTPPVVDGGGQDEYKENIDKVYDLEGLLAGGAAGLFIGAVISFDILFAAEIGMFIGLIIGTKFKKNKSGAGTDKRTKK